MKHLLRKSAAALVAAFLFISCGKNQAVKTEMFAPMAKTMKNVGKGRFRNERDAGHGV